MSGPDNQLHILCFTSKAPFKREFLLCVWGGGGQRLENNVLINLLSMGPWNAKNAFSS